MRAAIDIGSNTLRLLVARKTGPASLEPILYRQRMTRLLARRMGGFETAAVNRSLETLAWFRSELTRLGQPPCRMVATEAMRCTPGGDSFAASAVEAAGTDLHILSGTEEARLTTLGAFSSYVPDSEQVLVFDLGGGSVEVSFCRSQRIAWSQSYPLGVVRLLENPDSGIVEKTLATIRADLVDAGIFPAISSPGCQLLGTAGTMTTLAALHRQLPTYYPDFISGCCLTRVTLRSLGDWLKRLDPAWYDRLPGMERGRGELVTAGLGFLLPMMEMFSKEAVFVSDGGLLEGLLLDEGGFN